MKLRLLAVATVIWAAAFGGVLAGCQAGEDVGSGSTLSELDALCRAEDSKAFDQKLTEALLKGWKPDTKTQVCEAPLISMAVWSLFRDPYGLEGGKSEQADRHHTPVAVGILLSMGHDPNAEFGPSKILYHAVQNDHLDLIALLLEAGADPNCESTILGDSPLMRATSASAVVMLLEHGAKTDHVDKQGRSIEKRMTNLTDKFPELQGIIKEWKRKRTSG